jgi:hypothetical protein
MNVADSHPKRPHQLQKRASHRWWLLSVPLAATALAGCAFEELPPLPDHAVGGSLHGLWDGARAELTLTSSDGDEETLELTADGSFTFAHRLVNETTYAVELTQAPADHECTIANGAGTVALQDIDSIAVVCDGPIPIAIALANPVDAPIDTRLASQSVSVSLLQQEARFIVTAPGASAITLDGATLASGFPSMPHALAVGENQTSIQVRVNEVSRTFHIVIDRTQSHVPTEYAFLKASNLESGDKFGYAVAAMDDQIWVSAPDEDSATTSGSGNGATDSGALYVFTRSGSTWGQSALFKGTFDPEAHYGSAIAVSPSVAFASAPNEDVEHAGVGSLYWFLPNTSTWLALGRRGPADPANVSGYGTALALDGDTLAISDRLPGSVHILRGPAWNEEKVIRPANVEIGDSFGATIALKGDLLIVGARDDSSTGAGVFGTSVPTDNNSLYSGAVYVFRSDGGAWNLDSFIKAPNSDAYDKFGYVVAFDGQTLVVGVPDEASGSQLQSDNSAPSAGAVYTFVRENGTWRQEAYLKSPAPGTNMYFGATVDIRGDLLAAGEFSETGTVHLFQRQASGWTWIGAVNPSNGDMDDYFSSAIALTKTGLIATSPLEDSDGTGPANNASPNSGAAYAIR